MLMSHNDINLTEAVLLDQLQKGRMIKDNAIDMLRKRHLVEGRKPNIYIAKFVAQSTDQKIEYSKHKGLDEKSCEAMLLEALSDHGKLTREEIDKLLWSVLSDQLDDKQKKSKIGNLLTKLRKKKLIDNNSKGVFSEWFKV
jgi:ATP-dependent DNA helicase RecG